MKIFIVPNTAIKYSQGFSLVESMVVVVIIGILSIIIIPAYSNYIEESQKKSCLSEAKAYSNYVYNMLNDQNYGILTSPSVVACQSITDATGWTLLTKQKIFATSKSPSEARIECDIPKGAPCRVLP